MQNFFETKKYKNDKNRLRLGLAKVIVKCKMSRFMGRCVQKRRHG